MTRLEHRRRGDGLSPEQLAAKVNASAGDETRLSGRTIRRIEAGTPPTARTEKLLADHFGIHPVRLTQEVTPEELVKAA